MTPEQSAKNNLVVRSNPEMTIWEELEDQRSALSYKEECVLCSKGWHHTSSNPMFIWMWEKTWNGMELDTWLIVRLHYKFRRD